MLGKFQVFTFEPILKRGREETQWIQCGEAKEEAPGEYVVEFMKEPEQGRFQIRCKDISREFDKQITLKDVFMGHNYSTGKVVYTKIGIGFVNRDGSINVVLEAYPYNKRVLVRTRQRKSEEVAA